MKKFYVIGHPVAHSLSPKIHAMFAEQCGEEIDYQSIDFEPGSFIESLGRLRREQNPYGANITLPFKKDAADYCTELTERARVAGAVNTMTFSGHQVFGDNTDGVGFVHDVCGRCGFDFVGKRVLVLGAGGAARGVIAAVRPLGCARITVANRTESRAVSLAEEMGIYAAAFTDLRRGFDIVINATSAGLSGAAPAVPNTIFAEAQLACELTYSQFATPFMRLARDSGCPRVEDGLGMLIEQAAESFRVWLGVPPDTAPVYKALRGAAADF